MPNDILRRFPNQDIEKRPTECTAEKAADILGNFFKVPFDPGFNYAFNLKVDRATPTTSGANPETAMQAAVTFGMLPTDKEPFDATTTSELYEANYKNFPAEDVALAKQYTINGYKTLWNAQQIIDYFTEYHMGVSFSMKWYESFMQPVNGVLPAPSGNFTYHDPASYGFSDPRGLNLKPWLGPSFGDGGYCYLKPDYFYDVFEFSYGFTPDSSRWWNLATIGLWHPWLLKQDILPQLLTSK